MEQVAAGGPSAYVWFRFKMLWQLPALAAGTWFLLEYAGVRRPAARRVFVLLAVPAVLAAVLIVTNEIHHLFWLAGSYAPFGPARRGAAGQAFFTYAYLLMLVNLPLLVWLFWRSPLDRWPAALILAAHLIARVLYLVDAAGRTVFGAFDAMVVALLIMAGAYALALFHFRIFDTVRLAYQAVVEQMGQGVVVLDNGGLIADLNPAAAAVLGAPAGQLKGRPAAAVFPPGCDFGPSGADAAECAFTAGGPPDPRHYVIQTWPLRDGRGLLLGRLALLSDVTEQRRAEARQVEQQRALATLQERARLANELHVGVGRMMAYVSLQAQAVRKRISDGDAATADAQLVRLAGVAQSAHLDLREAILSLKMDPTGRTFAATLEQYLAGYRALYGVRAGLSVPPGLEDPFAPETGVQLLRVIQEALANAYHHGQAAAVKVTLARRDGEARVVVADDGRGFDPAQQTAVGHYGLAIMSERMRQVGGRLAIDSCPNGGTRVVLDAPLAAQQEAVA